MIEICTKFAFVTAAFELSVSSYRHIVLYININSVIRVQLVTVNN